MVVCPRCQKEKEKLSTTGRFPGFCSACGDSLRKTENRLKKAVNKKRNDGFPGYSERLVKVIKPRTLEQLLKDAKKFRGYK